MTKEEIPKNDSKTKSTFRFRHSFVIRQYSSFDHSLRDDLVNHFPEDVRKPKIAPTGPIREPFVIEPQEMQDRRMEIVDRRDVFNGVHPEFVRCSVNRPAFDAATGQPHRKTGRVMVAAVGR